MIEDWIPFWSGVAGGVFGAGGALGVALVGVWRERKVQQDEQKYKRADRLLEQGGTAAREALAITSTFFIRPVSSESAFQVLTTADWVEVRKIDDLAELIDNVDARTAVRAAVRAIRGASIVELAIAEVQGEHEVHAVFNRERRLLRLIRDVLGAYLRDETKELAALRARAAQSESAVDEAEKILGLE